MHVDIDGTIFAVSVDESQFLEADATVGLQLPSEHIHLFSKDTGLRLDDAPALKHNTNQSTVAA